MYIFAFTIEDPKHHYESDLLDFDPRSLIFEAQRL